MKIKILRKVVTLIWFYARLVKRINKAIGQVFDFVNKVKSLPKFLKDTIIDWYQTTAQMWKFVSAVNKRVIWFLIFTVVSGLIRPIVTGYAMKPVTDAISGADLEKLKPLVPFFFIGVAVYVLYLIFKLPIARKIMEFELEYEMKLKFEMYKLSFWFPYDWDINPKMAERVEKYERYQNEMTSFIRQQLGVLTSVTSAFVGLTVALQFDYKILVFMFVLALISTRSYYKTKRKVFEHEHETEESLINRRARNLRSIVDFPSNIQLHFTNSFSGILGMAWESNEEDRKREIERRMMMLKNENAMNVIEQIARLSVLAYVIWQSLSGNAKEVIPAYLMGFMFYQGVLGVLRSIADQDNMKRKIELVFQVIKDAKAFEAENENKSEPNIEKGLVVEFVNVTYKYPNEKGYVFENLNLALDFGNLFALCGKNGGGKTTLMFHIAGKLFPESGEILINGIPTTQIKKEWFNKNFAGYSPSMDAIRSLTIKELVDPTSYLSNEELLEIIDEVGLGDKITDMQTVVGSYHPNGTGFSAGQEQRLLIARLLVQLKRDNAYVLGDEMTSNIAPADQAYFVGLIRKYAKGGMIIAHNDSIISACDIPLECRKGNIFEKNKQKV